jgi:hypothetical protein
MRIPLLTAVVAGSIALASGAKANPTFAYTSYSVADGTGQGGATFNLSDSTLGVNVNAYAGQIDLQGKTVIDTYCVDISDLLLGAATYNTGFPRTSLLTPTLINEIAALISNGGTNYTAIQLAIWKVEYGSGLTITPTNGDTTDLTIATTDLNNVTTGTWKSPTNWEVPSSLALYELTPVGAANQNLVYFNPVPEPMSLAVLGAGLFGLGIIKRRSATAHAHSLTAMLGVGMLGLGFVRRITRA